MAKQGMKRPGRTHSQPKNDQPPVPEIQGRAKSGKKPANPVTNTDLGADNLRGDIPAADLQDQ